MSLVQVRVSGACNVAVSRRGRRVSRLAQSTGVAVDLAGLGAVYRNWSVPFAKHSRLVGHRGTTVGGYLPRRMAATFGCLTQDRARIWLG